MGAVERWRALPRVQVRTPALDTADLPATPAPGDPERLAALWQVGRLRSAIAAAAPELATAIARTLDRLAGERDSDEERLAAAVHRYAVRATTRATPRGLLAAVGFTTWGEPDATPDGPGRLEPRSRRRPVGGGGSTASDPRRPAGQHGDAPSDERLVANPSLLVRPTEHVAVFQVPGDQAERRLRLPPAALTTLIRWTSPLTVSAAPFPPGEIAALRAAGALVSTTRPTAPEPWPDGAGPEASDANEQDLYWADAPAIPREVRRQTERAMTALCRLGRALPADPALRRYAAAYEAVFGSEVTPLDRVVDPVLGLGRPQPPEPSHSPELEGLLLQLIDRAGGCGHAELTDADLDRLPRHRPAVASCDAFVHLAGGRLELTPRGVSAPAGRAHARFAHLDPAVAQIVAAADAHEERADPGVRRAILDYWHDAMIDLAVGAAPDLPVLLWSSAGQGRSGFRCGDLALTVADGLPDLRDRVSGRPVRVLPHHLVDTASAPWLLHLAHRVSAARSAVPGWTWGRLAETHVRLPRVSYAEVVLAPARWRLPDPADDDAIAAWRRRHAVPRWVRVDDGDLGVRLDLDAAADRELVRRGDPGGARWVIEALDRPGDRVLELVIPLLRTSFPGGSADVGVAGEGDASGTRAAAGAGIAEPSADGSGIGPAADAGVPGPRAFASGNPAVVTSDGGDVLLPGDRWWAVHLPTRDAEQENLVLRLLGAYLRAAVPEGAAGPEGRASPRDDPAARDGRAARDGPAARDGGCLWFFVRYNVPQPHLRIRVRADRVDPGDLFAAVRRVCAATTSGGFTVEEYRREPGRFGGRARLARVEDVLCADTAACLEHLPSVGAALRAGVAGLGADPATVAAVLIARAHRGLSLDLVGSRRLLERHTPPPLATDRRARAHEHAQRTVLRALLDRPGAPAASGCAAAEIHGPATAHLAAAAALPDSALAALTHLHLNRLGCDPGTEALANTRLLAVRRSRAARDTGSGG